MRQIFNYKVNDVEDLKKTLSEDFKKLYPTGIVPGIEEWRDITNRPILPNRVNESAKVYINDIYSRGKLINFTNEWSGKRIVFLGCSFTYGDGVAEEDIFPNKVKSLFSESAEIINLGFPGASSHRILRYFKYFTDVLTADYFVFLFPPHFRGLYVESLTDGGVFHTDLLPESEPPGSIKYVSTNYYKYINETTSLYYFLMILDHIISLSKIKKITPLFSSWHHDTYEYLKDFLIKTNMETHLLTEFTYYGESEPALDGTHPGVKSHYNFAKNVVIKLNTLCHL